jgi:hypothetical protein
MANGAFTRSAWVGAHRHELRANPRLWLILARNAIPIVGVLAFDWSADLVVASVWFDGIAAIAAILACVMPRMLRDTGGLNDTNLIAATLTGVAVWAFLLPFIALPYFILLIPLNAVLLDPELIARVRSDRVLWIVAGVMLLAHLFTYARRGYGSLPERESKQALRWDLYLLILRAVGVMMLAAPLLLVLILGGGIGMILLMVIVLAILSYTEMFPARALGAVFGDPSKLWQDPPRASSDHDAAPPPRRVEKRKGKRR